MQAGLNVSVSNVDDCIQLVELSLLTDLLRISSIMLTIRFAFKEAILPFAIKASDNYSLTSGRCASKLRRAFELLKVDHSQSSRKPALLAFTAQTKG